MTVYGTDFFKNGNWPKTEDYDLVVFGKRRIITSNMGLFQK
jgi:hypothetical protein